LIKDLVGLPAWANVTRKRRAHIERVAKVVREWAASMDISDDERSRWLRAVYFHDAIKDATNEELERLVPAEPYIAALKHGPAAGVLAERFGETDEGVLDAVRFHSIGFAGWDWAGKILFMADYLEPGRKFRKKWRAELREFAASDPESALFEVARARMSWLVDSGWPISRETWEFWNSIVSGE
jgi:HD superfamily phosphohydrolase YqeK